MEKKYYVVFVGRMPGVYDNWEECRVHTEGCPGARFKSYKSIWLACNAWADHVNGAPVPERPDSGPAVKVYGAGKDSATIVQVADLEPSERGWKPDSEYPPETRKVLEKVRGKKGGK